MTTVRVSNTSNVPFIGWLPCNVDQIPDPPSSDNWVLGKQSGLDTWNLDLWCAIEPGETKAITLEGGAPVDWTLPSGDPQMWGGVLVSVGGVPLELVEDPVQNGAAWDGHWRARVAPMLVADVWLHWYPDQGWAPGEIALTATNPELPDELTAPIPPDLRLRFGDAIVMVPGLPDDAPLMAAGDWLADGQARILAFVLCWRRLGGDPALSRALTEQRITANGIEKLHLDGNPPVPAGFDARVWTDAMLPAVIARTHDWFNSPLDPAQVSGASGAQGSQSHVAGPCFAHPAAVGPIYLAGLDASWPMHHLERDGSPLDWKAHPTLRMFYGRPNWSISADKLGKTRAPSLADSHGHAGWEDEHAFEYCLWSAARLRGTRALQWALRAHANHWLFRWVTEAPGNWLTANRGIGWMCLMACELFRNLEDRELARPLLEDPGDPEQVLGTLRAPQRAPRAGRLARRGG